MVVGWRGSQMWGAMAVPATPTGRALTAWGGRGRACVRAWRLSGGDGWRVRCRECDAGGVGEGDVCGDSRGSGYSDDKGDAGIAAGRSGCGYQRVSWVKWWFPIDKQVMDRVSCTVPDPDLETVSVGAGRCCQCEREIQANSVDVYAAGGVSGAVCVFVCPHPILDFRLRKREGL